MNLRGGFQMLTPPTLHGSGAYWIRVVSVGRGGGRSLAAGGAFDTVPLDELAGCSVVEPALFFGDKRLSVSGALICDKEVLGIGAFLGPKMLYGGGVSASLDPQW